LLDLTQAPQDKKTQTGENIKFSRVPIRLFKFMTEFANRAHLQSSQQPAQELND